MRPALIRYLGSDAARSQRWIAPFALFVAACALFNSDAGPLLTTYTDTIACLFVATLWMTWVVVNSEDAVQASVTAVTIGGWSRLRRAKLLTAYCPCAGLGAFATVLPLALANHPDKATIGHVVAGGLGHLLVAAAGVAIGSLLMQPVIRRPGWAFLVATAAVFIEIVVPNCPPVRQVLVLFNEDHPAYIARTLALSTIETAVLGAAIVAVALRVARSRS